MSEYLIQRDTLTSIANSIRSRTGSKEGLTPSQMPDAISKMKVGNATEPYTEETYNSEGKLVNANLYGYDQMRSKMFQDCSYLTSVSLPNGLTSISDYAFDKCTNLALTSLPDGITSIGSLAFANCTKLALTSLPSGVKTIDDMAFSGCTGLTSMTFNGTPTSISSTAFQDCTNLTTVNVPWAEGAVANAPWGATNATINYNYTAT